MPDWQEQYINPKAEQSFDDWQGTYPQMQSGRQVSYKTVTPLAFAQEGTQNKFHPYPNTSEYPQYQPNEFLPNGDINFKEVRKRVERENPVCRQASADLFSQKQSLVNFTKNLYDVYQNAEKLKLEPLHDKYKHAMVNCLAAQHGLDGLSAVSLVSQIKEWNDVRQGINTQEESEQDMVANIIGSYLGSVYPDENCENLLTPYISKQYPYSIK